MRYSIESRKGKYDGECVFCHLQESLEINMVKN